MREFLAKGITSNLVRGELNSEGNYHKVFDWDKAAHILRERNIKEAYAGLDGDIAMTEGGILIEGNIPTERFSGMYLSSNWATPVLVLYNGSSDMVMIECWKYQKDVPGWGSDTFWPESARKIFKSCRFN